MDGGEEKTVDEALLDELALEAAAHLRDVGAPLPVAEVIAALCRDGVSADEATDAVAHGVRTGALVRAGEGHLYAGIVRGWI